MSVGESVKAGGRATAVCGVGTVQVDPNEKAGPFNYVRQLTGAARSRWHGALLNSDDVHERAAALLEQSSGWDYDPVTYRASRTHGAAVARDELVQLAAGLNDLPIYAMAVRACQSYDGEVPGAACDRISLAEWADRDPDNAAPWLEIAVAAHARADRAAEFDAVSHAAHAHMINFYNDSLLVYSSSGMPPTTSALERAAYFDGWIGHVGGDGYAHSFASFTYCTAVAVQETAVHEQCEALAELFANQGRNTLDLEAAEKIGKRLGWPAQRTGALEQEALAIFRVEGHSGEDPWSCDNVRALNDFADIQARSGERAAARAAIQKSGKSIPELAQEQIDSVRAQ